MERLREISRGAVGRIGFGVVTAAQKAAPALLLGVRLPRNASALAEAAVKGGADVVVASILGSGPGDTTFGTLADERTAIKEIARSADSAILGVSIGPSNTVSADSFRELVDLGVDFVSIHPHRAPVELLQVDRLGRVLRLDRHYSNGPLRGLNDIAVHAFEVEVSRPEGSIEGLSVHDLAACRQIAEGARRPVLFSTGVAPTEAFLGALRNLGIEGVVYAPTTDIDPAALIDQVAAARRIIDGLGGSLGRSHALGEPAVVLPNLASVDDDEDDEF